MDKYVFLKVLENQEQVMIDPEYVLFTFTPCRRKKNQAIRIEENHCILDGIAPILPIDCSCCGFVALVVLAIVVFMTWYKGSCV